VAKSLGPLACPSAVRRRLEQTTTTKTCDGLVMAERKRPKAAGDHEAGLGREAPIDAVPVTFYD
jgi:hypothetical protein